MDLHIPINKFNPKLFHKDDMILIGNNKMLYIGKNVQASNSDNNIIFESLYERPIPNYNLNLFINSIPLEQLAKEWKKVKNTINMNNDQIVYLQMLRSLNPNDLWSVFDKIEINKDHYRYLYQNTPIPHPQAIKVFESLPTFWFFSPWSSFNKYANDNRECYRYEITKNITDLIDLTVSIISSNPFYNSNKNVTGTFYDLTNPTKYDKNNLPPLIEHANYRCLSLNNDLNEIKSKGFCDINKPMFYSGRRRLQEIFMKSRKYSTTSIYTSHKFIKKYKNNGYDLGNDYKFYNNLYYPDKGENRSIHVYDFDKYCLNTIGSNGFFFTNYDANLDGGEIMLTNTKNFIKYDDFNKKLCIDITRMSRMEKHKKNAYFAYLTGDSAYFLGAMVLGYSLKKVNTTADMVIMVTDDVPQHQIKLLQDFYQVVHVNLLEVPSKLFKHYEWSRFKHVFTKFEAFKFEEYDKVILIDIDMLVLRNMDHLFNITAPAAMCIYKGLPHNKIIPKKYLVQKNNSSQVSYGINAGLVLIKPSIDEYDKIVKDLNTNNSYVLRNPEQEYMSIRYANNFTHIDLSYNYQVGIIKNMKKFIRNEPHNIHYSWTNKPWLKFVDQEKYKRHVVENFIHPLFKKYYNMWDKFYEELIKYYEPKDIVLEDQFTKIQRKKDDIRDNARNTYLNKKK